MPALAIAEDRVGGFDLQNLSPGVSSPSRPAANSSAYATRPTYTYDLASRDVLDQDARTLAVARPRPVRVPAPRLYEEYHPYGSSAYRAVDSGIEMSGKRYRYTGKERDEETGLDHMRRRLPLAAWR